MQQSGGNIIKFGKFQLPINVMFWNKKYSYAILPCQQIFPGHVLLVPKRVTPNFSDLDSAELYDISLQIKFLTKHIEKYNNSSSTTIYVHNYDKEVENSIPHTFVHIIPRKAGDLENNDEIYERIREYDQQFGSKYMIQLHPNNISQAVLEQYTHEAQTLNSYLSKCYKEDYL